ncbi:hypothetical protein [Cystobacter fuscus]|uniref:hypothetical protein n=1 Tax=Cystobacter fuscus TaxID=43 RepID=UPI002B2BEDC7|nr:hypothetical protein F0U63_38780 [Cystobacter fuscus]
MNVGFKSKRRAGHESALRVLLVLGWLATGCGGATAPAPSGEDDASQGSLLPWSEGNRWTYRVTADGAVSQREVTVGPLEAVGGTGASREVMAHRVTTREDSGAMTLDWQERSDTRMVRYREQTFDAGATSARSEEWWEPSKLYLDETPEHLVVDASWIESYQETKQKAGKSANTETTRDLWKVISLGESVTVPAGTFQAIVVRKTGTSKIKTYWFVRGIGKVKETGEETEELLSYEVAPETSTP